jgi:hypothetical protein
MEKNMEFRAMREYGNTGEMKETSTTENCVAASTIRKWMMGRKKRT